MKIFRAMKSALMGVVLGALAGTATGQPTALEFGGPVRFDYVHQGTVDDAPLLASDLGGEHPTGSISNDALASDAVTAVKVDSETATDGWVLTADGASGSAWEAQTGQGGTTVVTTQPVSGDGTTGDPVTIADGAIDSDAIADAGITHVDLANNSVDGSNIRPDAVGASEIEAGAVDTSELADDAVTAAKLDSGSASDGFVATADGSGGVAYEATGGASVRDADGGSFPAATADCALEFAYDSSGRRLEICANSPHRQTDPSGNWDIIPDRTDLLVEESRAFVDSPDLNDYVFDAGARHFYQWSVVFDSGTLRNAWVQTTATNALAASRSNLNYAVRFLGEQDDNDAATALVHTLASNTDYFYVHFDAIRRLDRTSYTAPDSLVDHWEWRDLGAEKADADLGNLDAGLDITEKATIQEKLGVTTVDNLLNLTYRINEGATAADAQATYWVGNIYTAVVDMTVYSFQVETLVPSGNERTYRGTLVPLTQVSATSYTADSNPVQVVIRQAGGSNFGTTVEIDGTGTRRGLEVQAPSGGFHVESDAYFFLGVGISANSIDTTYVLGASGAAEQDHVHHAGFPYDIISYAAKGSSDEGSRTALSGTEFFHNTTNAIRMEIRYEAVQGSLQDGVTTSAVCTGNDLVLGRSQGLANLTASGACQSGGDSTVTTSAPVSGDGSASDPVSIADGAIDADALAIDSVNTSEIAGSAVRNDELANNAVSSAKIADGAVTLGKLGNGAVATDHIVDDAVTNAKMADGSVGTAHIVNSAVTVNKLSSGTATDGFVATADGAGGVAYEAATGGGTVETQAPVSGDGSDGDPVTIADGAITEPKLAAEVRELIRGATSTGVVTYAIDDDVDTTTDRGLAQYSGNIYRALEDLAIYRYRFTIDRPSGTSSRYSGHAFRVTRNGDHDYRPVSGADLTGRPTRSVTNNGVFIEPQLSTDFPNVGSDPDELEARINNGLHIESGQYFALIVNVHDDQNNRPYLYSSENINPVQVAHIGNGDFPHESIDFNHPVRANPIRAGQSVAEAGGSDWVISMQVDYAIAGGALLSAQEEGTQVYTGPTLLNCTGAGVTCSADTTNDLLIIDVPGSGGGTVSTSAPVSGDGSTGSPVTIADGAIDTDQLATDAVTGAKIAGRAINSVRIAIAGVTGTNIATNAITTSHIANSTITSVDLANDAVTQAKIADNAIDAARIESNAVGSSEIADNAVTGSEIADNAVGSGEITNGGVATIDIADDAVTRAKIADNAVGSFQVANDAITGAKIADNAVGASQISAGAVGSSEIADGSVTTPKIAGEAVTDVKVGSGSAADGFVLTADGSGRAAWEETSAAIADLQNVATNILPDADNSHVVGSEARTFSDGHFEILEVEGVLDVGDLIINGDLFEEAIEDAIAEDLVEGTGISIVRNDAGGHHYDQCHGRRRIFRGFGRPLRRI